MVAGRLGGRRLHTVRTGRLRPTSERVREAIFSILGDAIEDAVVLDLYAGTGALAIEALSRGARSATCVESDPAALRVMRRNVAELGLEDEVSVRRAAALDFCRRISEDGARFDVVFSDPPYRDDLGPILELIGTATWWTRVWVLEHASRRSLLPLPATAETRRWGDTSATFFWRA